MIAKIAVSTAVYAIDKPYDYSVPTELSPKTGQRVLVPFGRGDRVAEGIVLALEEGEGTGLKSLKEILDEQPLLDEKMLRLAAFMRERYFCTFYDAVRTVIPGGLWFRTMDRYRICTDNWREQIHRQPVATAVMESLQALGGSADWQELRKQFEELPLKKALRYLTEKGLLEEASGALLTEFFQNLRPQLRDRPKWRRPQGR
jgi:primosomal protein N' (replication factor Y)